jgi:signal transduction histidine kinase
MVPLERPGTREMAELSEGIGQMADALVDRAAYIRTLATHVSHEFKTPLASIQGAVELLQDHADGMAPEERQRFLGNIAADSMRLKALLDRLLDLARAENAVRSDELVNVRDAVETAVSGLPHDVTAVIDMSDDLEARIAPEALGIVLSNLIENAAQHGATEISITGHRKLDQVEITVFDNGCGITQANRSKVFEHFFTTRRDEGGTGLGLGIVRALLSAHGGAISLLDRDAGAAFRVRLDT